MKTKFERIRTVMVLALLGSLIGLTPARPARADDAPLVAGLVVLGAGALGVAIGVAVFSGKKFEGHVKNEYQGDKPMYAKNEIDKSLKAAFTNTGEQRQAFVATTAGEDRVIKTVAPTVGYDPATRTAGLGAVGTF